MVFIFFFICSLLCIFLVFFLWWVKRNVTKLFIYLFFLLILIWPLGMQTLSSNKKKLFNFFHCWYEGIHIHCIRYFFHVNFFYFFFHFVIILYRYYSSAIKRLVDNVANIIKWNEKGEKKIAGKMRNKFVAAVKR